MGICLVPVVTQRVRRHTIGLVLGQLLTVRPSNTMKLSYWSEIDRADGSCSRLSQFSAGHGGPARTSKSGLFPASCSW